MFSAKHSSKKSLVLFLVIWLHVTLLDLSYVNHNGAVFLWEESSRPITLLVHLLIASVTLMFYLLVIKLRKTFQSRNVEVGQSIWLYCSVAMFLTIGFLLF
ncbi:MAG: hypothetical protein MJK12_15855 [Colwellia sp.]|nr:hypothetical protein [Colwellia sp.]